jgi:hypothetical protein
MPAKQKVFGPYHVKNIGADGGVYMVVEMVDNTSNTYQELRPNRTYLNRQAAYGKCLRLNRRWQEQLNPDGDDLLDYWKIATN